MYRDVVEFSSRVAEVAYRDGSLEWNVDSGCWRGVRELRDGRWVIRSWPCSTGERLPEPAGRLPRGVQYAGAWRGAVLDVEEAASRLWGLLEGLSLGGCSAELVASIGCYARRIVHPSGEARHEYCLVDLLLGVVYGGVSVSDRLGAVSLGELLAAPRLLEGMCEKARLASRSLRSISPMEAGRWSVVLVGSAAASLIHELAHLLEGDARHLPLGARIAPEDFRLRDEPGRSGSPYSHVFDDEGVVAASRTLVAMGEVRGYLGVSWRGVGEPGSARGLFHPPKAMHTVLVLDPGDWRDGEIIEETRRGVLVETLHEAHVDEHGVITLVPELAWRIEHGEIVSALRVTRIRLRVSKELASIDALGRRLWPRLSTEKNHVQVEYAPSIRLEAYVD